MDTKAKATDIRWRLIAVVTVVILALSCIIPAASGQADSYAADNSKSYKVTFHVNGGKSLAKAKSTKTVTIGKKYGSLPAPTRTGYSFKGWYTAKSGGSKVTATSNVPMKKVKYLYAQWKKTKIEVTFHVNGGKSLAKAKSTKTVTIGEKYGSLPAPTRTGYSFKGWYTKKSGGSKITATSKVSTEKAITLYAQWTKNTKERTVTLDTNGGPPLPEAKCTAPLLSERYQGKTLYYYGNLPDSDDFEPTYLTYQWPYQFDGWYTESGKKVASNSAAASSKDHALYARWKETILTPIITGPLKELSDSMPQPDYEIVLQISAYIYSNYTYSANHNDGIFNKDDVKYGTLACDEAADLTYNLLKAYGFDYDTEQVHVGSPDTNHGWNIVKVQGKWYHLDNTPTEVKRSAHDLVEYEVAVALEHLRAGNGDGNDLYNPFLFSDTKAIRVSSHYRTIPKYPCPTAFAADHPEIVKTWAERYDIAWTEYSSFDPGD
jgi:uncharacterized repeat protein (TIGR02543 family)